MQLTFKDTVKLVVNSLVEGVMDKNLAIETLEKAAYSMCVECKDETKQNLMNCLAVIEQTVDDEIIRVIEESMNQPLDTMDTDKAYQLYNDKNMVLLCKGGHVMGMYRENEIIRTNEMEVNVYGQKQERACV